MTGRILKPAEIDVDAAATKAAAERELSLATPGSLPKIIEHIRRAQAANLRGQGSVTRGMTPDALAFFWGMVTAEFADPMLDSLEVDIALNPEHRRMFPSLPECDGVTVWREGGRVRFQFFNLERRLH